MTLTYTQNISLIEGRVNANIPTGLWNRLVIFMSCGNYNLSDLHVEPIQYNRLPP